MISEEISICLRNIVINRARAKPIDVLDNTEVINNNFKAIEKRLNEMEEIITKHYAITRAILSEELGVYTERIDAIERFTEANWQRIKAKIKAADEVQKKEGEDFIREMEGRK